jgi:hypothetical protein
VGESGTGKTTLARNVETFLPQEYAPTVVHDGDVSFDVLRGVARSAGVARNDSRVIPINIDHREATPPSAQELAEVKRFIRDAGVGSRCVLFWPQISTEQARTMSADYEAVAGKPPVELPVSVEGPSRGTWVDVAMNTLRLSNQMVEKLDQLGVDPHDYDPEEFPTIGEFLRRIAAGYLQRLLDETRVPVKLTIVFASESPNLGVLSQITNPARYGFVDGSALLSATPESKIGQVVGHAARSSHSDDRAS